MDLELRCALREAILANPDRGRVVRRIDLAADGTGEIEYEPSGLWVDPQAPGFTQATTRVGDEELVRAYLLCKLVGEGAYPPSPETVEVERVYKAVGRPGKGGRVDVLVRRPKKKGQSKGDGFLFIECKSPSDYDHDLKYIDGQLFRLSRQEVPRPKYLVYFTVELKEGELRERSIIVDTGTFDDFDEWDAAGQPIIDVLPFGYGKPVKRRYGNVAKPTSRLQSLDRAATPETLNRLRAELHDVIWGGGGTNNNEVFVYITKLILARIYDEHQTPPGSEYRFQRLGDAVKPETPDELTRRMNDLYREAETAYLALPAPSEGPAFDTSRLSAEKVAFVVGRLEGLSITENVHPGDLLGDFFEQVAAADFPQTKGQFFTPMKVVRFMLALSGALKQAHDSMLTAHDANGRPTLPYCIDPSCGSGTFLIEYMRQVTEALTDPALVQQLPQRRQEYHDQWFGGTGSRWAREFLFGIENNYDLGLAAKVNMVLHGDGSMNTWIASGLAPFSRYFLKGRTNILGQAEAADENSEVYRGPRNEQFDLILTNPPFSLKQPEDEKKQAAETFKALPVSVSEALFVERWYQLLREGGRFCAVVPESLLDTSQALKIRLFLLAHFDVEAVVSLPYDAFRPFTSTKTAIVLARKRTAQQVADWHTAYQVAKDADPKADVRALVHRVLEEEGRLDDLIFMAEPREVGYKRRKNLPDLQRPNDLVDETGSGDRKVIDCWLNELPNDERWGFRTSLRAVVSRESLRLDPKYRWLWDFQDGHVVGDPSKSEPLGKLLRIVPLSKVPKGDLDTATTLIELEHVESRQAFIRPDLAKVESIGSEKVSFQGAEIAFAKLEPYLGKLMIEPPQDAIGSTEWIGLERCGSQPLSVIGYLLLLPEMLAAFRRLQAGKRHARLDPAEMLDLRVEVPEAPTLERMRKGIEANRAAILKLRKEVLAVREQIDQVFDDIRESCDDEEAPAPGQDAGADGATTQGGRELPAR